jgi:hypothetical protein
MVWIQELAQGPSRDMQGSINATFDFLAVDGEPTTTTRTLKGSLLRTVLIQQQRKKLKHALPNEKELLKQKDMVE